MNPRIAEILTQLDAIELAEGELRTKRVMLHAELQEILETGKHLKRKLLSFEPDGRTIRWNGGSVRLGEKPCKFVKTLYEKRRMHINRIAKVVWGGSLTPSGTIRTTVCNLRKELANAGFPYEIITVTNKKIEGKAKNPHTNNIKKITLQQEIKGFRISVKKVFNSFNAGRKTI
jgi:DNA-binding response OmpR family regulator